MLTLKKIRILEYLNRYENKPLATYEIRDNVNLSNVATLKNLHFLQFNDLIEMIGKTKNVFWWKITVKGRDDFERYIKQKIILYLFQQKQEPIIDLKNIPNSSNIAKNIKLEKEIIKIILHKLKHEKLVQSFTMKTMTNKLTTLWSITHLGERLIKRK